MPRKAVARLRASAADFSADFSAAQALPVDAAGKFIVSVTERGSNADVDCGEGSRLAGIPTLGLYHRHHHGCLPRPPHAPVAPTKIFRMSVLRRSPRIFGPGPPQSPKDQLPRPTEPRPSEPLDNQRQRNTPCLCQDNQRKIRKRRQIARRGWPGWRNGRSCSSLRT